MESPKKYNNSNNQPNQPASVFQRIWGGLKAYLTDWRNLLGHALLGVFFVVIAVWAPINIWLKLAIIACLIALNILRMRLKSKNATKKESVAE
jgi:Flp pilus assembly protein TadB